MQTITPLNWDGALRLTTALYYLPSGRTIQGRGITPDIELAPSKVSGDKKAEIGKKVIVQNFNSELMAKNYINHFNQNLSSDYWQNLYNFIIGNKLGNSFSFLVLFARKYFFLCKTR